MAQLTYMIFIIIFSKTIATFKNPYYTPGSDKTKGEKSSETDVKIAILDLGNEPSVKKELKNHTNAASNGTTRNKVPEKSDKINITDIPAEEKHKSIVYKSPGLDSDTVTRGIIVFVGLSMLFFIYLGFQTYRGRKPSVVIKKYGVKTRRSDVEMRPLPLDDDDEDETLFDLGNLNKN